MIIIVIEELENFQRMLILCCTLHIKPFFPTHLCYSLECKRKDTVEGYAGT